MRMHAANLHAANLPAAGDALYLYGVVRDAEPMRLDMPAMDATRPLLALRHAGLTAIVSAVPLAEFRGPRGEQNLADLGWLGPRALAHEAVIEHLMTQCSVFPLPLGTLFSSTQALWAALDAQRRRTLAHFTWSGQMRDVGNIIHAPPKNCQANFLFAPAPPPAKPRRCWRCAMPV